MTKTVLGESGRQKS